MPIYGHNRLIKHPRSTIAYKGAEDKTRTYNAWYFGNPCCCREYTIRLAAYYLAEWLYSNDSLEVRGLTWFVYPLIECSGEWFDPETKKWKLGYKVFQTHLTLSPIESESVETFLEKRVAGRCGGRPNLYCEYRYTWALQNQIVPRTMQNVPHCRKNIDITARINHYAKNGIYPFWCQQDNTDCGISDGWYKNENSSRYVNHPITVFNLDNLSVQNFLVDSSTGTNLLNPNYIGRGEWDCYLMLKNEGNAPRWLYDAYANPTGYKPIDLWEKFGIDAQSRCSVQQAQPTR